VITQPIHRTTTILTPHDKDLITGSHWLNDRTTLILTAIHREERRKHKQCTCRKTDNERDGHRLHIYIQKIIKIHASNFSITFLKVLAKYWLDEITFYAFCSYDPMTFIYERETDVCPADVQAYQKNELSSSKLSKIKTLQAYRASFRAQLQGTRSRSAVLYE